MSQENDNGVCDTCGQPATILALDVIFDGTTSGEVKWAKWKPYGKIKRGCKAHPVNYSRWYPLAEFGNKLVRDEPGFHEIAARAFMEHRL